MTPQEALKAYRRKSPPELVRDADLFGKLALDQRTELLFYMIAHQANQLGVVSEAVGEDIGEMQPVRDQ